MNYIDERASVLREFGFDMCMIVVGRIDARPHIYSCFGGQQILWQSLVELFRLSYLNFADVTATHSGGKLVPLLTEAGAVAKA